MEVLRNCMVFFITLINFNWFKDTKDFATCNPVQDRDTMNNFENIFGPENVPRPSLFSTIGRDTTSAKKYMMNLYKFTTENGKQRLDDDHELVNQTVVEKADTVVSFVNHGKHVYISHYFLFYIPINLNGEKQDYIKIQVHSLNEL